MSQHAKKHVPNTHADNVKYYRDVEETVTEAQVKKSVWQRIKSAAKKVGSTIAKPFKFIGRKTLPTAKKVGSTIAKPFKFIGRKTLPTIKATGCWFQRNWGRLVVLALTVTAFVVAPYAMLVLTGIVLLIALVFIVSAGTTIVMNEALKNDGKQNNNN